MRFFRKTHWTPHPSTALTPFTSVDAPLLSLRDISPVKRGNFLKGKAYVR